MALTFVFMATATQAGIKDSLHNLSATGQGQIKSGTLDRICVFCHISHSAEQSGALWSRRGSRATYIPYSSSTAIAQPGQPTGASLMCLSCHDGTIALGEIISKGKPRKISVGLGRMPPGRGLQGVDLSDDHPISFVYSEELADQDGELANPGDLDKRLRLDANGELQCTTCHDAHDSPYEKLLLMANIRSQMCVECHRETGWDASSHSVSTATWNGRPPNPWRDNQYSTVQDNACENCHMPHSAQGGPRLMKHLNEEDNCSDCHNGNVASKDVMASMALDSAHNVSETTQIHDPAEPTVIEQRHVECVDCHDPHAANSDGAQGGLLGNVRGVDLSGFEVSKVAFEYQLCLRCHGDSLNQPVARTARQHAEVNMRLLIQPDNPSFHPVAGPGKSTDVPSLIFPLNEESVIGCAGCHNSNEAASAGGQGPEGPHGSAFAPLLVRPYVTLDNTPESSAAYALCYECHSRDSILSDESFPEHRRHVQDEQTPCNACHDPHGISNTQGTLMNNSHLINFDRSIVFPNSSSLLQFTDNGERAGSCDLACHGKEHNNIEYQP
jgi:predicted CXXCH cytochrome family protein